jgi:preprotein translocase subunit SecD
MNCRGLPWLLLLVCLPAFTSAASSDSEATRTKHSFAPVTFFIGCGVATRSEDKRELKRSVRAGGYMHAIECIDVSKQVDGVKVVAIAIGENEKLGLFDVILKLDPDGALRLAKLTDHGNPQPIVLSVKQEAVVASFIQAPFHGDRFGITADTLDDARKTADLFDK